MMLHPQMSFLASQPACETLSPFPLPTLGPGILPPYSGSPYARDVREFSTYSQVTSRRKANVPM